MILRMKEPPGGKIPARQSKLAVIRWRTRGGMGGLVLSLLVNALPDLFASNEPERANMSYQE
jgi:hypothetical protein